MEALLIIIVTIVVLTATMIPLIPITGWLVGAIVRRLGDEVTMIISPPTTRKVVTPAPPTCPQCGARLTVIAYEPARIVCEPCPNKENHK